MPTTMTRRGLAAAAVLVPALAAAPALAAPDVATEAWRAFTMSTRRLPGVREAIERARRVGLHPKDVISIQLAGPPVAGGYPILWFQAEGGGMHSVQRDRALICSWVAP